VGAGKALAAGRHSM